MGVQSVQIPQLTIFFFGATDEQQQLSHLPPDKRGLLDHQILKRKGTQIWEWYLLLLSEKRHWKGNENDSSSKAYFRQIVEPRMVKDRWWDTRVGVSNLLDLIWQPQHHFSQQLRVGLEHVSSMALMPGTTRLFNIANITKILLATQ